MKKAIRKNYMNDLELQSLHFWFKNAQSQNPPYKYNNLLKIMQDTVYKDDVLDAMGTSTQRLANFIQKPCIDVHERIILRNVFEQWKVYVVHKLHTRIARYKANYFYHKRLQQKVLAAFSKNVLLKWQHIVSSMNVCVDIAIFPDENDEAENHYSKVVLKRYFVYWCNYISIVHEKKEQSQKASTFYNIYCLKKCFASWKIYVTMQLGKKIRQEKVVEAQNLYINNILRRFLTAWVSVCEFTLQKDMIRCAIMHYEGNMLIRYFRFWKKYHTYQKDKLHKIERALAHNRKRLLKTYFRQFIMSVKESRKQKEAYKRAEVFYNLKLGQKVFSAWRKWYNEALENTAKLYKIRDIFENRLARETLFSWRLYIIQKKCKRRKTFTAQKFYDKKLASKTLRQFRNYVLYRKEKRIRLSYIVDNSEEISKQLQIMYIDKWRIALYSVMQEKRKLNQAVEFSELNLIRNYFTKWKEFSQQYKIKMIRKRKLNEIATGFLLKNYILHWHSKLQDIFHAQKKEMLAISIMQRKVVKKCFLSWRDYIIKKVKMKNDIEAAVELHKQFLLHEGLKEILRNSLRSIDYQRDMQLETATIRSYKNLEILKEYFDKWHSFLYVKNKSKHSHKKTSNSDDFRTKQAPFNNFQTSLVLPEYMTEENKIRLGCNSLATFPQQWSFNTFQSL